MGKAQSKRSVDITTDPKKGAEEEVTGKLEKIEDVDQKQINGDATPQENAETEQKKDADEAAEDDKDLTTEKTTEASQAAGDTGDQNNTTTATTAAESPKDDAANAKDSAPNEEISPLADESTKKSKKEKVKKKWSFRNLSFGKKDKQKPSKTEETTENSAAATNGEAEKTVPEEVNQASKEEGANGDTEEKSAEKLENGDASEKELNGQKTPAPTPTEEKPVEITNNENTTTATTATSSVNESAVSTNETAIENQTENKAAISANITEAVESIAAVVSNGEVDKNGVDDKVSELSTDANAVNENNKAIPNVNNGGEIPHQNGTNGSDEQHDTEAEQQTNKKQIEVNTNSNTDNNTASNVAFSNSTSLLDPDDDKRYVAREVSTEPLREPPASDNNVVMAEDKDSQANPNELAIDTNTNTTIEMDASKVIKQSDNQSPPPLPNSPPPSQVSAFVFKLDVDDLIKTVDDYWVQEELNDEVKIVASETETENVLAAPAETSASPTVGVITDKPQENTEDSCHDVVQDNEQLLQDTSDIKAVEIASIDLEEELQSNVIGVEVESNAIEVPAAAIPEDNFDHKTVPASEDVVAKIPTMPEQVPEQEPEQKIDVEQQDEILPSLSSEEAIIESESIPEIISTIITKAEVKLSFEDIEQSCDNDQDQVQEQDQDQDRVEEKEDVPHKFENLINEPHTIANELVMEITTKALEMLHLERQVSSAENTDAKDTEIIKFDDEKLLESQQVLEEVEIEEAKHKMQAESIILTNNHEHDTSIPEGVTLPAHTKTETEIEIPPSHHVAATVGDTTPQQQDSNNQNEAEEDNCLTLTKQTENLSLSLKQNNDDDNDDENKVKYDEDDAQTQIGDANIKEIASAKDLKEAAAAAEIKTQDLPVTCE